MGDSSTNKWVTGYWRRRGYKRLGGSSGGDEFRSKRSRWSWRIRMPRRLKIKLRFNPRKLIGRVQDAYVRMMMRVANCRVVSGGALAGYGGGGRICEFGTRHVKEYDEKMIIQMYNSMVKRQQAQLLALEVQQHPQITCSQ